MSNELALKSFRLKNFKAIRDSGVVKFTPLTVLIGDNGSGKSSLIEGMQTYQRIVTDGLDEAMNVWRGFENIRYGAAPQDSVNHVKNRPHQKGAIEFSIEPASRVENSTGMLIPPLTSLTVACAPDGEKYSSSSAGKVGGRST